MKGAEEEEELYSLITHQVVPWIHYMTCQFGGVAFFPVAIQSNAAKNPIRLKTIFSPQTATPNESPENGQKSC